MGRALAGCISAVMAGATTTQNLGVIDSHHGRKDVGRVAVLADVRCLHVGRVLANSIGTVVAADAIASDIHVVEIGRHPANRAMTVVAGVAAGDVSSVLADGSDAIVA